MDDKTIPYFVHEGMMVRQERTIKRLWILCIIMFLALVGTNAGWIWYENQFIDEVTTQEVDQDVDTGFGDGDVYVHGIGDIYGESKAEGANNDKNP